MSALTTGRYGDLGFSQSINFNKNSGVIHYAVTLTNNGRSAINNVAYASGFDPDQDVYAGGNYETTNTIGTDRVVAYAPVTGWGTASVGDGTISITGWSSNPYYL